MPFTFGPALRGRLAANLARLERRPVEQADLRPAAVVVVVVPGENGTDGAVLLTRRGKALRRHAGQYALPGGRLDPGETATAAALRELSEELGLDLDTSHLLGMLDDMPTRSGFRITPVVAWADADHAIVPQPDEVERVFRIPLEELTDPSYPSLEPTPDGGEPVLSLPLPTLGHPLYAPTAAILYQFREVAIEGRQTRVAHFDQPKFAWR